MRREQNKRALALSRHGADPAIAAHGTVQMRTILEQGKKEGFESADCFTWAPQWGAAGGEGGGGGASGAGEGSAAAGASEATTRKDNQSYFYESGRRTSIRPLGALAGTNEDALSAEEGDDYEYEDHAAAAAAAAADATSEKWGGSDDGEDA